MNNLIFHKFYAASISIGMDGSMLVASTRDRILVWGIAFCFIAPTSLICLLISRSPSLRRVVMVCLLFSLAIPVFIIPSIKNEYIHVSRDQITINPGYWYLPSKTVISLDGLRNLSRQSNAYMISNFIGDDYVTWYFERHDGSVQNLVLNDFFSAHSMAIAHYIRDRGHRVEWLYSGF